MTKLRNLSGADAVHLASALEVGAADLVVAVWDRRLHRGAVAEGLTVAQRRLPTPSVGGKLNDMRVPYPGVAL